MVRRMEEAFWHRRRVEAAEGGGSSAMDSFGGFVTVFAYLRSDLRCGLLGLGCGLVAAAMEKELSSRRGRCMVIQRICPNDVRSTSLLRPRPCGIRWLGEGNTRVVVEHAKLLSASPLPALPVMLSTQSCFAPPLRLFLSTSTHVGNGLSGSGWFGSELDDCM